MALKRRKGIFLLNKRRKTRTYKNCPVKVKRRRKKREDYVRDEAVFFEGESRLCAYVHEECVCCRAKVGEVGLGR